MMKAALAVLGGFVATGAVFAGGAASATWFLVAKDTQATQLVMDQNALWTSQPKVVEAPGRDMQRLAVADEPERVASIGLRRGDEGGGAEGPDMDAIEDLSPSAVDPTVTAAVPQTGDTSDAASDELLFAHLDWCASRYRSYRPRDNSYTPFSGGRRTCVSPYTEALQGSGDDVSPPPAAGDSYAEDDASFVVVGDASGAREVEYQTAEASGYFSEEHLDYCFSRYRSYRPEDNSYQPYGGGPRRQCE